jgi:ribose 5-phosphate isomerase B
MKIAVGADKYGYQLLQSVKTFLQENNVEVEDYGVTDPESETPYYQVASAVASKISTGEFQKGVLICGTGMGMAIMANKHSGVYAAVCENSVAAERARSINDSNVLTLGGFVTTDTAAREIVNTWLKTEFTQGWEKPVADWLHNSKKDIDRIEQEQFKE